MRLLLDTHVWLWALQAPERLDPKARGILEDAGNEAFLSAASTWEIAIKASIGRLKFPKAIGAYSARMMREKQVQPLAISHLHAARVASLPRIHRDPFDRVLVAQAEIEGFILMTADRVLSRYPIRVLQAGLRAGG